MRFVQLLSLALLVSRLHLISFVPSSRPSLTPQPLVLALALHLCPPICHTFSPSPCWLCPSSCSSTNFFHGFFGCLFPFSSLLLLLKPRDAAHLTAVAVSRACLSPCVAATTAVNLVQTRCLFYSPSPLSLSRGRKKKKRRGGGQNETAKPSRVLRCGWESSFLDPRSKNTPRSGFKVVALSSIDWGQSYLHFPNTSWGSMRLKYLFKN